MGLITSREAIDLLGHARVDLRVSEVHTLKDRHDSSQNGSGSPESVGIEAKRLVRRVVGRGETPSTEQQCLSELYHEFEDTLEVIDAPEDGSLKSLVTFDDCKVQPVHRWYTFKEGYSHQLLATLQKWGVFPAGESLRLLDPFCGVGTTLVTASYPDQSKNFSEVVGVEVNPTIKFIAETKVNWANYDSEVIEGYITKLKAKYGRRSRVFPVPELSTFSCTRRGDKIAFHPSVIQDLLYYRQWILNCPEPEKDFLLLAWLSIIEEVSYASKDGRALRLLKKEALPDTPPNVKQALLDQLHIMKSDLIALNGRREKLQNVGSGARVVSGDARDLPFGDRTFDAICYSPPYLNNIDYTEVYKMELWLKGDVSTQEEFRNQRLKTMRSHPSIIFPPTEKYKEVESDQWLSRLRSALMLALPYDEHRKQRERLFAGYIDDLLLALGEQQRVAVPGAPIVCVVGNSLFGGEKTRKIAVCTDLLIAAAAQAVGLVVEQIRIARHLPRRDNQNGWLRESIIIMRKPN
ncbi:class I SAM-dependent methyltransferase [bacterium]|nr:MAG: class I SAM-dependent methyltransferase [bacterium]